jgi:polygalacturonase
MTSLLRSATIVVATISLFSFPLAAQPGWDQTGQILGRIRAPEFPARNFPITDYGAKDGADSTAALGSAVKACHDAGGGHVVVPPGTFLTGAIHLLSNVDLHLAEGATLKFSTDPEAYLPVVFTRWESTECMNYSAFIYAFEQENIAVTGPGTLDGSANESNWWAWAKKGERGSLATPDTLALLKMGNEDVPVASRVFGAGHHLRPNFFQAVRCHNVLISDVTIVNSPMWELNPVLCTNVIARGVKISTHGANNDGFDPESCRDVLVENCTFDTGDDCIAIKSGRNRDGRRVGVVMENMIVRGCSMKDGHAGVAIGSETSGGCRNIFVEDCRMDSPNLERVLRIKSNATRGGTVENIYVRKIAVGRVAESILTVDLLYEEGTKGDFPPVVRHVGIDQVQCLTCPRVLWIQSFAAATVDDIVLSHSTFGGVQFPDIVDQASRVQFDHVNIKPAVMAQSMHSRPATAVDP